jgi:hypothetical protein
LDPIVDITPERFREGLTIDQFVQSMTKNQELFEENYRTFDLDERDIAFLRGLNMRLNVVVLAEDWCGDVLRYLPAFACLAEAMQTWDVRVFYRDENPELIDMCLKEGRYRAIPVFLFYDKEMNEIACFTEKPAAVYAAEANARQTFASEHPELPDAALPLDDMSEATRAAYVTFIRQFRADNRKHWQQLFIDEIKNKLQQAQTGYALA